MQRPLTPRKAAWLVLRRVEKRDAEETERLNRLRLQQGALAGAVALAEEFAALVRARGPERLEPWLARAQDSPLAALRNFAKKLDADIEAGRAAVSLPWSNGAVEGQINRREAAQAPDVRPRQPRPAQPPFSADGLSVPRA